jgi:hypothetical protein
VEKITLKLRLCRETENALCVWDQETKTYRGRNEIWLPKTQIAKKDLVENNVYNFQIEKSLAEKRGLINERSSSTLSR